MGKIEKEVARLRAKEIAKGEGAIKIMRYFRDPSTRHLNVEVKNTGKITVIITGLEYSSETGGGGWAYAERILEPGQSTTIEHCLDIDVTKIKKIKVTTLNPSVFDEIEPKW